ncbi:MAG: ATP-dependent helicase [Victivallales bacterium]|nr:ATP-dependent helicase [Victivallales bacterium]
MSWMKCLVSFSGKLFPCQWNMVGIYAFRHNSGHSFFMVNLTYICRNCGKKSVLDTASLRRQSAIVCPHCGKTFSETAPGQTTFQPVSPATFDPSLNPEQMQAASYDGPADGIMLLAGAGCGKTRTMIARALFLMKIKGVPPERIALLTFTRRATREIADRVSVELPGAERKLFIGTFHRFSLNLMHRFPALYNLHDIKILDRGDQEIAIRRIRASLHSPKYGQITKKDTIVPNENGIIATFSYMNNRRNSVREYYECFPPESPDTIDLMEQAYDKYTEYKAQNNYLDFDDILLRTAQALEEVPALREKVQNSLDYILVDEMQDTSPVQWDILKSLYPDIKLFCVGDDAQSIYAFRGADFECVHNFCNLLPNSIKLRLTENYRSTQCILDLANALLAQSPLNYDKVLRAHSGEIGMPPKLMTFNNEDAEAQRIVRMIAHKLDQGVPPKEIMVLLRSANHARMVEYQLRSYGIPYRLIGGVGLLRAAHIKDVISTMEALTVPQNEISWLRFLLLLPKIGEKSAERLYDAEADISMNRHDFLRLMASRLATKNPAVASFIGDVFDLDATPDVMLTQILAFFDETNLLSAHYDKWAERRRDLDILVEIASQYTSVTRFLEAFKLDPDAEAAMRNGNSEDDLVTLITVHSAKGTEADVCFVLRVQPGSYPHYKSETLKQIEEDRRTLYVAMTRARKELYLTNVEEQIFSYRRPVSGGPSFLDATVKRHLALPSTRRYSYDDL